MPFAGCYLELLVTQYLVLKFQFNLFIRLRVYFIEIELLRLLQQEPMKPSQICPTQLFTINLAALQLGDNTHNVFKY